MIDSHAHLFAEQFDLDRKEVIKRAKEIGVSKIILVGFSEETNLKTLELSQTDSIFYPTYGLHPSEVKDDYLEQIKKLEEFIASHKTYAIGECGLDYYWDTSFKEEQKHAFRLQIELAIKNKLPLIIHCREAIQDTYDILREYPKAYGVMHCYSGSLEMALEFIKLGFYISLGGPVTFKNAKEPKRVATNIPIERLLIETDSPYLAPSPYRGKRNESSYVSLVLAEISKLRNMNLNEVEKVIDNNTKLLFKLED